MNEDIGRHLRSLGMAGLLGLGVVAHGEERPGVLAESGVVTAKDGDRSEAFEIDLKGLETVLLKADDVDGNSFDWIAWYDLGFVDEAGNVVAVGKDDVISESQGWGKMGIDRNAAGKRMKVGGEARKGFGGHAPSRIKLRVPKGAVKLVAKGGLDDAGAMRDGEATAASARFSVVNSDLGWVPSGAARKVDVKRFAVPEGLEVTLWAESPMLFNPTNMDVDSAGRIWVAEGVNYRRKAGRRAEGDRIVVLEDTDGDGKADSSHVFVQEKELATPLGVSVIGNQVIVPNPPNLVVYTDVDGDLRFDPELDKKEVLLTGFNAAQHDHSLHSVTAGPDGKWYFNNGNCGAIFTDKSGKTFRMNGIYRGGGGKWFVDNHKLDGAASDDGYVWTSGFGVRMNPDGTEAEIVGHGYRNSYEQAVNSMGDIFQNDNDDFSACRNSYVLEYGSAGFFTRSGQKNWKAVQRPGEPVASAHWRQRDPGTIEVSHVYTAGSPTGVVYYENGALGKEFEGTYLACDAARNVVFGFKPEARGAGFKLEPTNFLTSNISGKYVGGDFNKKIRKLEDAKEESVLFRPSDVCVGPDGALYVADWYDGRVGGHSTIDPTCSGAIYRIAPKGFKPEVPELDLDSVAGQIEALRSPAVNVRNLGFVRLKAGGEKSYAAVSDLLDDSNKWVAARGIWLLPYLGEKGLERCVSLLVSDEAEVRMVALRALRRAGENVLPYARKLAGDPDAGVRRDVALALRHYTADETGEIFVTLAKGYDGEDKNGVEAIGLGAAGKEDAVWLKLRAAMVDGGAEDWSDRFAKLTWRLWPVAAVDDLKARAMSSKLSKARRELAVESLAFINDEKAAEAMLDIAAKDSPVKAVAAYWLLKRGTGEWAEMGIGDELKKRGIYDPEKIEVSPMVVMPASPKEKLLDVDSILKLKGDAERGKAAIMRCVMCHEIDGTGPAYGPALKGWASTQALDVVIRSIVDPSADIAHGFKGQEILLKDGGKVQGLISSKDDPVIITSTGGVTQLLPRSRIKKIRPMKRSLMMSADQLGLTDQDVADVVEFMRGWE